MSGEPGAFSDSAVGAASLRLLDSNASDKLSTSCLLVPPCPVLACPGPNVMVPNTHSNQSIPMLLSGCASWRLDMQHCHSSFAQVLSLQNCFCLFGPVPQLLAACAGWRLNMHQAAIASFLFRFFLSVSVQLEAEVPGSAPLFGPSELSGAPADLPSDGLSKGAQLFPLASPEAIVGHPTMHMAARSQVCTALLACAGHLQGPPASPPPSRQAHSWAAALLVGPLSKAFHI